MSTRPSPKRISSSRTQPSSLMDRMALSLNMDSPGTSAPLLQTYRAKCVGVDLTVVVALAVHRVIRERISCGHRTDNGKAVVPGLELVTERPVLVHQDHGPADSERDKADDSPVEETEHGSSW